MALTWTDLYNEIMPAIGAFPKKLAMRRLYRGAREFCDRSEGWRHVQTQNYVSGTTSYTLAKPYTSASMKRLAGVWYSDLSERRRAMDGVAPDRYSFSTTGVLKFWDDLGANVTNGLTTEIVLIPDLDAHEVTEELMTFWGLRAFAEWAVFSICSESGKPWANKDIADKAWKTFLVSVNQASGEAIMKRTAAPLAVVPRYFA